MSESMTVAVGLDVHARSIRLAAVRADELLEERRLPTSGAAGQRVVRSASTARRSPRRLPRRRSANTSHCPGRAGRRGAWAAPP
jgi:hypothetical protein